MIKQTLLEDIADRRVILEDLKRAYDGAKADLERLEQGVIQAIEAGDGHERGPLAAGVSVDAVRRPRWKEEFTRECGEAAAARVLARTEPTEHRKLVLIRRAGVTGKPVRRAVKR